MANVILAVIILLPLVLTYFLRSNAALAFAAACVGYTLQTSVTNSLADLLNNFRLNPSTNLVGICLLFLPPLLTLLLSRHSFSGKGKVFLQAIPALCTGAFLAILAAPLITETYNTDFNSSQLFQNMQKYQALIVGVGAGFSLVLLWMGSLKHHDKPKKHK
jgi:hypothetical protein